MSALIAFRLNDRSPNRKTDSWEAWRLHDARHIGQVRWSSPFRQYCFFATSGAALDPEQVREIAAFIESETEGRRKGRRAFRD